MICNFKSTHYGHGDGHTYRRTDGHTIPFHLDARTHNKTEIVSLFLSMYIDRQYFCFMFYFVRDEKEFFGEFKIQILSSIFLKICGRVKGPRNLLHFSSSTPFSPIEKHSVCPLHFPSISLISSSPH